MSSDPEATSTTSNPAEPLGKKGELTEFQKGWIVGAHDFGASNREIGRRLGRNESTVRTFLKRYQERGESAENRTQSGRRPKIQGDAGDACTSTTS